MSADSLSIRAESLLEHREFVRRLAKTLVRDEHAAQDVVQETWLEALRHPPDSAAGLRGWLARVVRTRAQNAARGESRRASRELAAARQEGDDSEERLRERVAMQHRVVEAVLGLKEPYKTVVLLHYYEGLSPSAIAARRGAPAGTVRAQLSRAHDLLRERLDAEFGGERAVWSAGLAALARGGKGGAALAPKLALLGAAGAAAAVPVLLWVASASDAAKPALVASDLVHESRGAVDGALAANPSPDPDPASAPAREPNARAAMAPEPPAPQVLPKEELESKSVRQLLQLAIGVQQVVRTKLLTPSDEWKQRCAALLALPDTGLARILHGERLGTSDSNALGLRGAGACFSLATRRQSWDDEPDLFLADGTLRGAGQAAGLLDLGDVALEDLQSSPDPAPRALGEHERERWSLLWADAGTTDRGTSDEYNRRLLSVGFPPIQLVEGHAYLVRGITAGAHDLLGAIRLLAEDENGWTFAWRVLRTWPVVRNRGDVADPYWLAADPPESLAALRVDALVELQSRIRAVARAKLYEVPESVRSRLADSPNGEGKGVTRLLARGRYEPLVEGRGGGACFSFATRTNDCEHAPDLSLDTGMYWTGIYGSTGYLLDLGEVSLDSIGGDGPRAPASLPEASRDAWELLWRIAPLDQGSRSRSISIEDENAARRLGLGDRVGPAVGHSYLVRTIVPGEHDVLAVFMTAARDEHGDWIIWRVIWNRKLERDPKPR